MQTGSGSIGHVEFFNEKNKTKQAAQGARAEKTINPRKKPAGNMGNITGYNGEINGEKTGGTSKECEGEGFKY